MEKRQNYIKSFHQVLWLLLLLVVIQVAVWLLPSLHFAYETPLHTIFESIAILVSMMVFAIGWDLPSENRNANFIMLAVIFFGVGVLDFIHTLSYPGMPDFITPSDPEKAINFWLMARLLSAFGLLFITWQSWQTIITNRSRWLILVGMLFFLGGVITIGFRFPQLIPHTFVAGEGLTDFKRGVELFIIILFATAAIRLFMQIKIKQVFDVVGLFAAASVLVLSEICFTLYAEVNDIFNLLGHVYKVIAYIFIYKSILVTTIREPYRQLKSSQNTLQNVIDNIPLRVFWKDRESRYEGCNILFSKDAGGANPKDIVGKFDTQLWPEDVAEAFRADDRQVINSNTPKLNYEEPQTRAEGKRSWLRTSKVPLVDADMQTIGILGIYDDITDTKELEEELYMSHSAIENAKNAHFWVDHEGCVTYANKFACTSLGYSRDELVGMYVWEFDPDFKPSDQPQFWVSVKKDGFFTLETKHKRKDGTVFPVEVAANYISVGNIEQVFCVVHDLTNRKQAEEMVWQHANLDSLTGLPNRRMFKDRLEQEIKKAHRTQLPLTLLFLDLDNFKEVNDVMGHSKGDLLLKEAAHRLVSCVRESDTVARFGGDEFTILLSEVHAIDSVDRILQHILELIAEPFKLDGDIAYVTASIGVTCYPDDGVEIDELLKNADQSMYAAKANGRNGFSYYTPKMQAVAKERMKLANDLRSALPNNQLWVAYQPIIEIKSGKIVKAEALIRWQHPEYGLVRPDQFISIAEHTGLIHDIGEFVFRSATQAVKRWQGIYDPEFQVSVNVSPMQFNDKSNKFRPWHQQLTALGLSGKSIVVEITEGLLLEASTLIQDKLLEFRDAGIQVALDDFGTGYSALSYLKKFDIDYIKIDQSFVRKLSSKSEDFALCEAIIVMAHKLGLKVVAEGVETAKQRELLKDMNCDYAQGYLISKPVTMEAFEKLLS
jgi:diguanylate cyclase (GGDEF)-like protein/PAS domain S-box-containing protein